MIAEKIGMPRASVIVPVYNGAAAIVQCLSALRNQTLSADLFEVIVVDDGSTDGTYETVRAFSVNLVSIQHGGPAKARNKGAALARGDILVFTDADCVPEPDWLEKMLSPFDDPGIVGVKGAYITAQREPSARFAQAEFETRYNMMRGRYHVDFVDTYSGAFRRNAFHEVGGFDPSFPKANNEDVDLSYRMAAVVCRPGPDGRPARRMVFAPDAKVRHTHPATWRRYAKNKFWRGYWRVAVYRRFMGKVLTDSYTPQSLKVQIVALAGFLLLLPAALLSPWALAFAALFPALFAASSVSFCREVLRFDLGLARYIPLGLILRAGSIGLGIILSLFKPPIKSPRDSRMPYFILVHMLMDMSVLAFSFWLALWMRRGVLAPVFSRPVITEDVGVLWAACVAVWFLAMLLSRTYASRRGKSFTDHVLHVVRVNIIGLALLTMLAFLFHVREINRSLVVLFTIVSIILLSAEKVMLYAALRFVRAGGVDSKRVLLVGKRTVLLEPLRRFTMAIDAGFAVAGILSPDPREVGDSVLNVPVVGVVSDLDKFLHENPIDEVFFAAPVNSSADLENYLAVCARMGIRGRLIANMFEEMSVMVEKDEVLGMSVIAFVSRAQKSRDAFIKRGMDVLLSLAALVVLSPLLLVISLLIRLTTRGPSIFLQKRMGLNGRTFTMFKFRTMVKNAESLREKALAANVMDGPVFKAPNDPRVTWIGRWLRRFSLDELPQLWNVLKGEMSLVGPRPLPVYEAKEICGELRRRVSMKPGLTGLWQASGRNEVNFKEWMRLDLEYVDHWSLKLDIIIILKTIVILFKRTGAW